MASAVTPVTKGIEGFDWAMAAIPNSSGPLIGMYTAE